MLPAEITSFVAILPRKELLLSVIHRRLLYLSLEFKDGDLYM